MLIKVNLEPCRPSPFRLRTAVGNFRDIKNGNLIGRLKVELQKKRRATPA